MTYRPSNMLTVVIRDDGPLMHCDDRPSFRSVRLVLTEDQVRTIRFCGPHEAISQCFIEPEPPSSVGAGAKT